MKKPEEEIRPRKFDISKQVNLIPKFQESEVNYYFQHFEKTAINLQWRKAAWPMLLQITLSGKALRAYATLSIEERANYNIVKRAILKRYELVPEAYKDLRNKKIRNENLQSS